MPRKLPPKDVAIIGLGWTGSILANELTDAGLDVVAIERGPWRDTATDFPISYMQDELRYRIQHELFLRNSQMSVTFRNNANETALPVRNWGAFMLGNGVGGAGVHWNAETWRFLPTDFTLKSHLTQRYGANFLPADMTIQDWGVTYDDLEPHYDAFEYLCGTSGQAGNLNGAIQDGGNPFEGPRSRPYPTPPQKQGYGHTLFARSRASSSATSRFRSRPAILSQRLHQSARRHARAMHLLRLLRMVRLRQLFQGQPADHDPAGADAQIEFRGAHRMRSHPHQSRQYRQARDRRHLRRYLGRGIRAAGRSRAAVRVPAVQRAAAAAVRHRHAVRSADRPGPDRAQFHASDDVDRARLLRQGQIQLQSVRRVRRDRHDASTSSTATISTTARSALSAAAISAKCRPTAGRSRPRRCRPDTPAWGSKWKQALKDNYLSTINRGGAVSRLDVQLSRQLSRSRSDL